MSDRRKLVVLGVVLGIGCGFALLNPYSWISYVWISLGYLLLGLIVGNRAEIWFSLLLVVSGFAQNRVAPEEGGEITYSVAVIWMLWIPLWSVSLVVGCILESTLVARIFRREPRGRS